MAQLCKLTESTEVLGSPSPTRSLRQDAAAWWEGESGPEEKHWTTATTASAPQTVARAAGSRAV